MDFDYSPKTKELQAKLNQFMADYVYPAESAYADELAANTAAGKRWTPLKTIENLKPKAQAQDLWNLFLPVDSAAASGYSGAGLTNQEYAPPPTFKPALNAMVMITSSTAPSGGFQARATHVARFTSPWARLTLKHHGIRSKA